MSQTFEELPYYLPDAECPFFFLFFFNSVSRPLDLCKANKSPSDKKKKKQKTKQRTETENVINSDLTLGLKGDLANKTKALTKGERLKTASDNEKH